MQDTNIILFPTVSVVVIVAPGPDNILVLTCGILVGLGLRLAFSQRR